MSSFDVIGVGACAVDYLGIVSEFPKPDTKIKMKKLIRQGGGPVATALVALARLGTSVSYVGKFGGDGLSSFALDGFVKEDVDISHVIKEEGAGPTFAFVVVDEKSGERTIWWTDEQVREIKADQMDKEFIASARILLIDEYWSESALAAGRIAREAGVQVVLDAERPENPHMNQLIQVTNILIVPEEFALGFAGGKDVESSAEALLKLGPRVVVVTLGVRGSFCKTAEESFHQPAFKVDAVDTTGCGDVFHGGFIYGLLQDWPLKEVAEFASAVAALKCRALGGRAATPTLDEMKEFLLKRGSEEIKGIMVSQ